ncbi:MAG: hypothetical protein PF692_13930 [Kiritimatiellae bacterium]|jgi:hypothetical protein|nr:hypothetical protein [Kiritimatiellia bacterium]
MKKTLKLIITCITVTFLVAVVLFVLWFNHPVRLIVQNKSTSNYSKVHVTVGQQNIVFGDINYGKKKERWFLYKGSDSGFTLNAVCEKKEINYTAGYITSGPGFETVCFEIKKDNKISFKNKR